MLINFDLQLYSDVAGAMAHLKGQLTHRWSEIAPHKNPFTAVLEIYHILVVITLWEAGYLDEEVHCLIRCSQADTTNRIYHAAMLPRDATR